MGQRPRDDWARIDVVVVVVVVVVVARAGIAIETHVGHVCRLDDGLARLGVGHRGARGRGEMCGDVSGGRRVNARDECQMNESNE